MKIQDLLESKKLPGAVKGIKVMSPEEWSLPQQVGIKFYGDYPAGVRCNFVVVFEKQQSIMFNVINSEVAFQ